MLCMHSTLLPPEISPRVYICTVILAGPDFLDGYSASDITLLFWNHLCDAGFKFSKSYEPIHLIVVKIRI